MHATTAWRLTEGKLERLKKELASIVDPEHDSVIIYKLGSVTYAEKEEIGKAKTADPYILESFFAKSPLLFSYSLFCCSKSVLN